MIYYVGSDIFKYKQDFYIISNIGKVIVENSSSENNKKLFLSPSKKVYVLLINYYITLLLYCKSDIYTTLFSQLI